MRRSILIVVAVIAGCASPHVSASHGRPPELSAGTHSSCLAKNVIITRDGTVRVCSRASAGPASSVHGLVVDRDDSRPIAGATVQVNELDSWAPRAQVEVDARGWIAIDLEPGRYAVTVRGGGSRVCIPTTLRAGMRLLFKAELSVHSAAHLLGVTAKPSAPGPTARRGALMRCP